MGWQDIFQNSKRVVVCKKNSLLLNKNMFKPTMCFHVLLPQQQIILQHTSLPTLVNNAGFLDLKGLPLSRFVRGDRGLIKIWGILRDCYGFLRGLCLGRETSMGHT